MNDWMISFILPDQRFSPKLVLVDGDFMFSQRNAKKLIAKLRKNNPNIEYHLSKNGKILKEEQ